MNNKTICPLVIKKKVFDILSIDKCSYHRNLSDIIEIFQGLPTLRQKIYKKHCDTTKVRDET